MDIVERLQKYIEEFNKNKSTRFDIDTIRIEFNKTHTLTKLNDLGEWRQLREHDYTLKKIRKKEGDTVTTAYELKGHENIYYYNLNDRPKYRKARLVIYGLKQYKRDMSIIPRWAKTTEILLLLANSATARHGGINVDVCHDTTTRPDVIALQGVFELDRYRQPKSGSLTDTYYIDRPDILGMERVVIYDKSYKDKLKATLYRIEATMGVYNIRALFLPLEEFLRDMITPMEGQLCKIPN